VGNLVRVTDAAASKTGTTKTIILRLSALESGWGTGPYTFAAVNLACSLLPGAANLMKPLSVTQT
jgi:hypothetical protein